MKLQLKDGGIGVCRLFFTLTLFLQAVRVLAALPSGWGDTDIGSPALAGSAGYTNGVWTVAGGGADIWDTSDQFHFLTNSLNGDGAIVARVISQTGTDGWTQAGIMLRNDVSSNSPQVSLMLTPGNGVSFRYRSASGGTTLQVNQAGISAPEWIRLSRSNNVFTATYSSDGLTWTQLGTPQTVAMSASVLAGLAVTAHNNSLISTGAFTDAYIVPGAQAGTQTSLINPYIGGQEMAWQTTWPLPQLNVASNALTPRMGWNCYFVVGVSGPGPMESIMLQTADALVTNGLAAAGYKYEVIDGSWIATGRGYRDSTTGDLMVTNTYWPDGLKYVADYVHSKGLLMGGYSDIGSPGYGSPAQIGMYAYYQHDADQFAAWGWDFIKIDDHGPGDFYAACHAILNNSSGRPMALSLSTPQADRLLFANRIANSYRVANDISFTMGTVSWSSILTEFDTDQTQWFAQAPGHWNDPDMLCTGLSGISDLEGRSTMNMWCILAAPLMIGTDVRMSGTKYYAPLLTAATLNTLTNAEVIAVDQDALGAVGRPVASSTAVYAKPLGSYISGQYGVLLLNRSSSAANLTVNWADVGLMPGSTATVRDLWAHADLGAFAGSYTATNIPAHGSVLLKVAGTFDWNRPRTYEAEWAYNSFSGNAYYVPNTSSFSASAYVTGVGNGPANAFQFNLVAAPSNGLYQVDTYYACATARTAQLSVNGGAVTNLNIPATGGDTQPSSITAYLQLAAGNTNTLTFGNATGLAPNFDKIVVSRGTPAGFVAVAGDGVVNLSWTASASSASFNIYRGTTSGGESAFVTGLTTIFFADTNVVNGQTYFYTVTAINPALGGESPPSVEASAKPRYATTSTAYQSAMLAAAPAVWWRLNETNGALLYDAIGSRNGTNAGAVVLGVAGPRPPDFLGFEMANTAAQFANGTANSCINVPALNLNTNTVTITAWIYPTGIASDYAGVCFYRSGGTVAGINYGGSVGSNTGMIGYTWDNDQNTWNWTSGLTPPANQWSFVALVVQPTSAIMYLVTTNGRQSATNTYAHPSQGFSGTGTIGTDAYDAAGRAFNGLIDEVAVFNSALTQAQIQSLFANGSQLDSVQVGCQRAGANLNLTWPQGTLLQSTNVTGPWSRASTSASPLVVSPTNNVMFYRVFLK